MLGERGKGEEGEFINGENGTPGERTFPFLVGHLSTLCTSLAKNGDQGKQHGPRSQDLNCQQITVAVRCGVRAERKVLLPA